MKCFLVLVIVCVSAFDLQANDVRQFVVENKTGQNFAVVNKSVGSDCVNGVCGVGQSVSRSSSRESFRSSSSESYNSGVFGGDGLWFPGKRIIQRVRNR